MDDLLSICQDVSFRFKLKERLQCCGDVFLNILMTNKGASANGMF